MIEWMSIIIEEYSRFSDFPVPIPVFDISTTPHLKLLSILDYVVATHSLLNHKYISATCDLAIPKNV